jgi:tellurite resistance protein
MKIETSTIRRLRDALLKSGRRPSTVMSPAFETLARAGILSDEERVAVTRVDPVAETLVLMIAADGKITQSEREAVRGALRGLTDNVLHDGTIDAMIASYQGALAKEGREARLRHVADHLAEHPSDAESAFTLAAAVALADDDVDAEERQLVTQLASWFGIAPERAAVILDQLADEQQA